VNLVRVRVVRDRGLFNVYVMPVLTTDRAMGDKCASERGEDLDVGRRDSMAEDLAPRTEETVPVHLELLV
jgi:hypothetical protein